ncbi:hypothetical protein ACFL2Q_06855 [Thermodesulfobacteriota bacterium]
MSNDKPPSIFLTVGKKKVGYSFMYNYISLGLFSEGQRTFEQVDRDLYIVPTYVMKLEWVDEKKRNRECLYEVVRFGVTLSDNPKEEPIDPISAKNPRDETDWGTGAGIRWRLSKTPVRWEPITYWDPLYKLHTNQKADLGAWHIQKSIFYIHTGPADPRSPDDLYGSGGCIEVCRGQWRHFLRKIDEASRNTPRKTVAESGMMVIDCIDVGGYPKLFKAEDVLQIVDKNGNVFDDTPPEPVEAYFEFMRSDEDSQLARARAEANFIRHYFGGKVPKVYDGYSAKCEPPPPNRAGGGGGFLAAMLLRLLIGGGPDPVIFDLNRDGITTTPLGIWSPSFDLDANGFAENTAWVGADDGLLVKDRNGNGIIDDGRELFGDATILSNGEKASSGFQALVDFDNNADGKIDAADPEFSQLRIWQDADSDGYSSADELYGLDELGITSIDLHSTETGITDEQGNTQKRLGSFQWADGTSGLMGEYTFERDTMYTTATESLDVPERIAELPFVSGYGNVYDLPQKMVRDTSGRLESSVNQFIAATDVNERNSLMDDILFQWTDSENIDPTSRGEFMDARKLAVLESFFGQDFVGVAGPNPAEAAGALLHQSYHGLFELIYSQLMSQTHLKDLFDEVWCGRCEETNGVGPDMSVVEYELNNRLAADPEQGRLVLSEFARTALGESAGSYGTGLSLN